MQRAVHFKGLLVLLSLVIGLCIGEVPRPASGHEGHDNAAAGPAPPGVTLSPRLVARSNDFELVGVAQGRTLSIYLDRFADNEPVIGAKIDVEVDGQTISAHAAPNGVYLVGGYWVVLCGEQRGPS